jgi:hypothetical protein
MARLIHAADMRVVQTLSSGIVVRQDFRTAARFVFFDTGNEYWQYATHGGTMFIVLYKGKPYGLTCGHVLKDFSWHQLVVTDGRVGKKIAGLRSVAYPGKPNEAATGTDVLDIAVIVFANDVGASFFEDPAYILDEKTMTASRTGDTVHVAGALKAKSEITEDTIAPVYCLLEMTDDTRSMHDPTLRRALGKFEEPEFADVVGLSGSPVFNVTRRAISGIVVRGGLSADVCTLWYVDMFDIVQLLETVHANETETFYVKHMMKVSKVPRKTE